MNQASPQPAALRVLLGLLGLVLLPMLMLADTAWAVQSGWPLAAAGTFGALLLLAVLACLLAVLCLASRRYRGWLGRRAPQLWLLSLSTLAAWLVVDRSVPYLVSRPAFHLRPPHARYVYDPDPFSMPGVWGEAHYTTNSDGVRGPEMPADDETYRILCVGSSATEGYYLDDEEAWPRLLCHQLNDSPLAPVWVGSAASADLASGHHLRFLRESPLVDQVDCIVLMQGATDVMRLAFGLDPGDVLPPYWLRSETIELVKEIWHVRLNRGIVVDTTGERLRLLQSGRPAPQPAEPPDVEAALADFARRIRAMHEVAAARGVRLVLVTQPVLWADDLSPHGSRRLRFARVFPIRRRWQFLSPENLRQLIDGYNQTLTQVAAETQTPLINAAAHLTGHQDYFYDDYHLNEQGAVQLADLLAEWFEGNAR